MAPELDRRRFLTGGAVGAAGLLAAGCSSDDTAANGTSTSTTANGGASTATTSTSAGGATSTTAAAGSAPTTLTVADFADLATCVLLPEKTAGPYPLDQQFDRRDITEGLPGNALRLGLRVVDDACVAVPGAKVEIWHCDATGDYSAYIDGRRRWNARSAQPRHRPTGPIERLRRRTGWWAGGPPGAP